MATIRQSIVTALRADGTLMGLLAGDTERILLAGQVEPTASFPLLVAHMGMASGRDDRRPHVEETFEIRAYTRPQSRNTVAWNTVDSLLNRARAVLHRQDSLSADDDDMGVFRCAWEFRSNDQQDFNLKAWFRYDRFRVYAILRLPASDWA